jgi:hypothetical protein
VHTIIDFIAGAFLDSGNVISNWYTNTGAITVNVILSFAPSVALPMNATAISVGRRVQNIVNDGARMKNPSHVVQGFLV